jgi:predicted PurR-regulated permease PerM
VTVISAQEQGTDLDADRTLRLAAPSLKAVVRMVAIVVACAIVLYLTWRLREVVRLVVISLFVGLALLPVVDALDARCGYRGRRSSWPCMPCSLPEW